MKKLIQLLSLLAICIYPNLFMYFHNAGEARIRDVVPIIGLFMITAAFVLLISILIMKDIVSAIVLSDFIMIVIINFEILSNIFNWLPYKYICMLVCVCILMFFLVFFLKKKRETAEALNLILLFVFLSLIVVNAVPAIPVIMHKMDIQINKPTILSSIDTSSLDTEEKPNIYYLIFDEYGGEKNLEKYFEYSNRQFLEELSNYGFNISSTSKNEESISTVTIIPNLLNLNYVAEDSMIQDERLAYMKEPELFKVMQYLGYDIVTCSSTPFLDNGMSVKNYEEQEVFEDKAGYFVLKNSCFIHLYKKYVEQQALSQDFGDKSYGDLLIDAFQYYEKLTYDNRHEKAQICIGYFQTPHVPFFYKSDGTLNPPDEHANWLDHDNYIEYLKWTNGKIQELVKAIIDNDRNSIIIIQSDHGARYPLHVEDLTGENPFSVEDSYYQNYILNCLYYKGEKKDIEGLSGVNTLRYVLNEEFNTNLEMIFYNDNLTIYEACK